MSPDSGGEDDLRHKAVAGCTIQSFKPVLAHYREQFPGSSDGIGR